MKGRKLWLVLLPVAAVLLELLPYSAVLNFGVQAEDGSIETVRRTYSYFSLTPFGYALFGPLLTAILSCLLLAVGMLYLWAGKGKSALKGLSVAAVLASLSPLLYGVNYFSTLGAVISALLLAEAVAAFLPEKR
ncbi:MAG: hypothetical protein LIO78_02530 [Clostridiales bacterium]|nr:hypothetical protein [Clostridiales bacterium]